MIFDNLIVVIMTIPTNHKPAMLVQTGQELLSLHVFQWLVISRHIMAILYRSLTLLLVTVITISQVEGSIISDVLSWVGLGGSDKSEEEEVVADVAETDESATEDTDPPLSDEESSNVGAEDEGQAENSEEGSEEVEEESEEETNDGRAEEL